jgi:hypothetical protein
MASGKTTRGQYEEAHPASIHGRRRDPSRAFLIATSAIRIAFSPLASIPGSAPITRYRSSNRESEIRNRPNPFRISATSVSNREKTPTSHRLPPAVGRPVTDHNLIGAPASCLLIQAQRAKNLIAVVAIRIVPKSFTFSADSNSNRRLLHPARIRGRRVRHTSPAAFFWEAAPRLQNLIATASETEIAATHTKQSSSLFLTATGIADSAAAFRLLREGRRKLTVNSRWWRGASGCRRRVSPCRRIWRRRRQRPGGCRGRMLCRGLRCTW